MPIYDTSDRYALRALSPGSQPGSGIDDGFLALRNDVSAKLTPYDSGALASRPVSTPGSPGKAGRTYRATDRVGQTDELSKDYGTGWLNIPVLNASGQLVLGGDTNLYRAAANVLKTDDQFWAAGAIISGYGASTQVHLGNVPGAAGIVFGSAGDTNLFRSSANSLATDDSLYVALDLYAQGNIYFGASADTNLYRSAANVLKTDDQFWAAGLTLADGLYSVTAVSPGYLQYEANAGHRWTQAGGVEHMFLSGDTLTLGSARDTNLYRGAANQLKTDDAMYIGGDVMPTNLRPRGGLVFTQLDPLITFPAGWYLYQVGNDVALIDTTSGGFTSGFKAGHFTLWSDERVKTDVEPVPDPVDKLMAIGGKRHAWAGETDADPTYGFLAQDVQKAAPELVSYDETMKLHAVDYDRMVPIAWEALRNAVTTIRELRTRIETLEGAPL